MLANLPGNAIFTVGSQLHLTLRKTLVYLPRIAVCVLLGLFAGCAPRPARHSRTAPEEWDRRLAPFEAYDILILNPEESQDRAVIETTLRRAHMAQDTSRYRWLTTSPREGRRGYGDLVGDGDEMDTRRQLRSCVRRGTVATDTTQTQVLILRVLVAADGTVLQARVRASTVGDPDALVCLVQTVAGWRLSEAPADEAFDVPLVLIPSPHGR